MPRNPDERRAARHYRLRGYRILGTNVWAGGYELDLIARRGRRLVFCEVKGKTGDGYGDPLEMVGEEKLRRMQLAAEAWLARNPARPASTAVSRSSPSVPGSSSGSPSST